MKPRRIEIGGGAPDGRQIGEAKEKASEVAGSRRRPSGAAFVPPASGGRQVPAGIDRIQPERRCLSWLFVISFPGAGRKTGCLSPSAPNRTGTLIPCNRFTAR